MADDEPPPLVASDSSDEDDDTMPPLGNISRFPPPQTRVTPTPETRGQARYPQIPTGLSKAKTEEVKRAMELASQWGAQMSVEQGQMLVQFTRLKDFNQELMASNKKSREDFDRCQKQLRSQEIAIAKHAEAIARHEPKMNELRAALRGKEKKISKCIQEVAEAHTARHQAHADKEQLEASLELVSAEAQRDKASFQKTLQQASHEADSLTRRCELLTQTHNDAIDQVKQEAARDLTQLERRFHNLAEQERLAQAQLLVANELLEELRSSTISTPEMRSRIANETIHRLAEPLEECAVCFENDVQGVVLLPCLHKEICRTCVQHVVDRNSEPLCPVCQTLINQVVNIAQCL